MAKLIVKPTINFLSTARDADLIGIIGAILGALTGNLSFPNPTPTLGAVRAALEDFKSALSAATLGGILLTLQKNDQRSVLVALMRQLAGYVAGQCKGDLVKLLGSAFPIHQPTRHTVGPLTRPTTPVLKHTRSSGQLQAKTKPVRGVFTYNWTLALASSSDVILQSVQSTGANVLFTGLTPGQVYRIAVQAFGAAGPTDFSNAGQLMSL